MAELKYLVLHCTATPMGREVSSDEIRAWHTNPISLGGRGWKQVGYTDMIHLDGRIERLVDNNEDHNVDPWEITNGAKGHNAESRHVVYVGGCWKGLPYDTRTFLQRGAMECYVKKFKIQHPGVQIVGHNELNENKDCPSFNVQEWLKSIGINQ